MPVVNIPSRREPKNLPEVRVLNPGKGLNIFSSPQLIDDHEASDLLNIAFTQSGCPTKAYGFTSIGTGLTAAPKGLGALYTTSTRQLLTVDNGVLKYLNGNAWTSISGTTFTAGSEVNFVQCRSSIYIWNGAEAASVYDGSTLSRPTTTISGAFAIFYSGYQIASGVASQPNRVYISSPNDASDFTDAADTSTTHPGATVFAGTDSNYIDINAGDGDKVTGLSKFQNVLVIFKERSTFQLTFDSSGNPSVTQITAARGAVSHKSIDTVDNDVFFLSRDGFYVLGNEPNYYSAIRTNELSVRVKPIIDTITENNLSKCSAVFYQNKYYASIPTGGTSTNNKTLVYDKRYLAWSVLNHITANSWIDYIDSSNIRHFYFADDTTAFIYEINTGYNSNGTAINSYWTSKSFDAGKYDIYKRWVDITLLFRQVVGTVTITIYTDSDSTAAVTVNLASTTDTTGSLGRALMGNQIMGGSGNAQSGTQTADVPYRIKINKKARTVKVKVSNSNNNETFTLLAFVFTYIPYSHYSFPSSQKIYA